MLDELDKGETLSSCCGFSPVCALLLLQLLLLLLLLLLLQLLLLIGWEKYVGGEEGQVRRTREHAPPMCVDP